MSSKEDATLNRLADLLNEILKWTRFEGIQRAREVLRDTLTKDSEKLVYYYSDGRGSRDVAKLAGVSDFAVRSYWKKWATMGLVEHSPKFKGRFSRVFSLEELGIEVPYAKGEERV